MKKPIDELFDKIRAEVKSNPSLERQLLLTLQKANHSVQMYFIQRHEEGYCAKFAIPDRELNNIFFNFKSINMDDISRAFDIAWALPKDKEAHMHRNSYYQQLILVVYYAARTNNANLGEYALRLILYRLWNGRLIRLIKYCNPEIMASVVANSSQHLIKKYQNPLDLIQNHFAPTIYQKYLPYMLKDSNNTKIVFEQAHHRLKQIFSQDSQVNLLTKERKYNKGLQPLYYKAHENRNKIVKKQDSDDDSSLNKISTFIDTVVAFISIKQVKYDDVFIRETSKKIKGLKSESIPEILTKMHQIKYIDILREILELYFTRIRGVNERVLCSSQFIPLVEKNIISSKNTQNVEYLKILCDKLLDSIFKNDMAKKYDGYLQLSSNARTPYKNIIIYGLAYNIQRAICEYK